ncbi:si:dkey-252h13.5' isoform 2 [Scophthalmus maximus]|uniref:Si:dkey-252h13.5' isoform 2 n=1 Tax=Scophthalmus maximus TaxID=52904 RepID=A0A2U9B872_SCOMX|nr:si:dkey-252h13.5' isoform 2 [Scophthalmus maximus]
MELATTALLSVGFLLLLPQGTLTNKGPESLPIRVTVENDLSNMAPESYSSSVVEGGVLLGALRRLQETQQDFKFTVKEDPDFGLLLQSVNGVAGGEREQTYWEILSESSGEYTRLDVGECPPQSFNTTYPRKT